MCYTYVVMLALILSLRTIGSSLSAAGGCPTEHARSPRCSSYSRTSRHVPALACPEQRRATPQESTLVGMPQVFILNSLKLFRINTYEKRGGKGRKRARFAQFWCNLNPFRINTSKSVSKQTTLTPFRMNTYEKTGGWGGSPQTVNNPRAPRLRVTFSRPYLVTSLHPYFVASRRSPASSYTIPPTPLHPPRHHFLPL